MIVNDEEKRRKSGYPAGYLNRPENTGEEAI